MSTVSRRHLDSHLDLLQLDTSCIYLVEKIHNKTVIILPDIAEAFRLVISSRFLKHSFADSLSKRRAILMSPYFPFLPLKIRFVVCLVTSRVYSMSLLYHFSLFSSKVTGSSKIRTSPVQQFMRLETFLGAVFNDLHALEAPKDVSWHDQASVVGDFISIYDWDRLTLIPDEENILKAQIILCVGPLPCSMSLLGTGIQGAELLRIGNGSFICLSSSGCSGLYISKVRLICAGGGQESPTASAPLEVEGAFLQLDNSSMCGCFSQVDGGSIRAYGGAFVQVAWLRAMCEPASLNLLVDSSYAFYLSLNVQSLHYLSFAD
jgi:hypothetical protein